MLNKVWGPFTFIISRLKYAQKFILISVLFMIPILLSLYNLISSKQEEIKKLESEIAGVEQVAELMPLMLQIQQHRGLVNGYLNGNDAAKPSIEAKQQEIHEMIEQTEANFDKQGLPKTYEQWISVKEDWETIRRSYESLAASDSFDRHSQLVKQIEELIVSSADESGLSLDNEINSFYMVKLTVEELPALIEGSAVIRGRGNGVLASKTLTDELKLELLLESNESQRALAGLNKSLFKISEYNRVTSEELLKQGERAAQSIENYLELLDQEIINQASLSMDPDSYFSKGTETIESAAELFRLASTGLLQLLQERIDASIADRNVTFMITFATLILVAIFYVAFYRSVMETVHTLKQRAEAMAKGDFSQEIVLHTRDELQLVGNALNEMQKEMNLVLGHNQKIAEMTLQSSRQLSDISLESANNMQQVAVSVQGLSEGTAVQDRAVTEMATAMNEMSIGVMRIAEAASDVAHLAMKTSENAELGNQQLEETANQMASIQKTQAESSQIVAQLDEYSVHIHDIIDAIMDVSQQTRLLSLNANIEAARAGVHGTGFGVVAKEIGKLAEETSRSANSIFELLHEIRSLIGQTVAAMESMHKETNAGMESIERTKASIHRILSDIQLVNEQIQEVSAISEEISAETEQVTASIAEISDVSHKTSYEAETMAAAAEEQLASMEQIQSSAQQLKDMSQQLENELNKFILQDLT